MEDKAALAVLLLQHGTAGHVAGQQIRGELHAPKGQTHQTGHALDQLGLAQARQAFEQDVTSRKTGHRDHLDQLCLAQESGVEPGLKGQSGLLSCLELTVLQ